MKKCLLLILSLISISCGRVAHPNKSEVVTFEIKKEDFNQHINSAASATTVEQSLGNVKTIRNDEYPIELALFADGSWRYQLRNLGDGQGTWHYKNGTLKLFAKRDLFDMYIDIKAIKENGEELVIEFADRFGHKILPVKIQ